MRERLMRTEHGTHRLMCIIIFLLSVIALELWVARPDQGSAAYAQIPDTGLQRLQLIDETRTTNKLLGDILDHLRKGRVKVELDSADKQVKSAGISKGH